MPLKYALAQIRHHPIDLPIRIFQFSEVQGEITHVFLEIHQHLRVYSVVFSNSLSLVINCLSRCVQSMLGLTDYPCLIVVDVFNALDVVFTS